MSLGWWGCMSDKQLRADGIDVRMIENASQGPDRYFTAVRHDRCAGALR
jgi:hypothetical protein